VVPEHAGPVAQTSLEKAAVHHPADVARRREVARAERAIDKVVVRDAGELVEPEGDLEFADLNLRVVDVADIDVDVLPLRLRRQPFEQVLFAQLLLGQLALDLELNPLEEVALHADAVAVQLEV